MKWIRTIVVIAVLGLAAVYWLLTKRPILNPWILIWIALFLLMWKVDRVEEELEEIKSKLEGIESEMSQPARDDADCAKDGFD